MLMLEASRKVYDRIKNYSDKEKGFYLSAYFDALQDFKNIDTDLMLSIIYDKEIK